MNEGLLGFLQSPVAQGLLSAGLGYAANAGRGGTWNSIGRAGLTGLAGFSNAIEMQKQQELEKLRSEALRNDLASKKRKEELIGSLLGNQGSSIPSGASVPSPSQAGPMGPTAPQSITAPSASRLANLSFDQLMALKLAGVDVVDIHKYANDPRKLEQGATYEDRVTGKREFMPRVPEGGTINNGTFSYVPGYLPSIAALKAAEARATAGAQADFDPVQVVGPDGAARYVPRSAVVGGQQNPRPQGTQITPDEQRGRDQEAIRIVQSELQNPKLPPADRAGLERELARLQGAQRQSGFPTPSLGGFQATPTTAQVAAAAGAKAKAEAEAKGLAEREGDKAKRADRAVEMVRQLERAENLLNMGPTASGAGALTDKVLSFGGISTSGAETASALENISGWLTANVPRMEGPQSNFDVDNYKIMAGRVGDRTLPVAQRLAALNEVKAIQSKYAHLNSSEQNSGGATGGWGDSGSGGWSIKRK